VWQRALTFGDDDFLSTVFHTLTGFGYDRSDEAVVYVLAGHSGVYIGKANLGRPNQPGLSPRAVEHMRALTQASSTEGRRPRYKQLRLSLGSVGILPLAWTETEAGAYLLEAAVVRVARPLCNTLDAIKWQEDKERMGRAADPIRRPRKRRGRPPKWRRSKRYPWMSIWAEVQNQLVPQPPKQETIAKFWPGQETCLGPFARRYTTQVVERAEKTGEVGPLSIWDLERPGLLLSYLAAAVRTVLRQPEWFKWELAQMWYDVLPWVEDFIPYPSSQVVVKRRIGTFLRNLNLPPWCPPPLVFPSIMRTRGNAIWTGRLVTGVVDMVKPFPARSHLLRTRTVRYQHPQAWSSCVTCPTFCRTATK